ncbi:MAG: putative toxin-antitoxin system toxin component, PIN family [Sulfuricaulis sp.]|nr:putative toxin-antitoxin system toxin component, PIN family [Sulfuricaulis sp.]
MKVFPDTNVWVSAAIFPGLCADLLGECADREWLLTSELVRQEAHEVLTEKFPKRADAARLFDAAWREAGLVKDADGPRDDNDARLIATAIRAGANLFVTGDKRVLRWSKSPTMHIVSPRDTWVILFAPHLAR